MRRRSVLVRLGFRKFLVGPFQEIWQIWAARLTAIVLSPGDGSLEESGIDGRHFLLVVIIGYAEGRCGE